MTAKPTDKTWDDDVDGESIPKAAKSKPRGQTVLDFEDIRQRTQWILDLEKRLSTKRFKLDPSIVQELQSLAKNRILLVVVRTKEDLVHLMEANSLNLSTRDRVTEIVMSYTEIEYELNRLWEAAQAKVMEIPEYQQLTNQPAREAFVVVALHTLHRQRNRVQKVIRMAAILQKHLSDTDFSIQRHVGLGETILNQRSA